MRFLITNDDGIEAPGLKALERVVEELNASCITIAPDKHLSGCSHQVTVASPLTLVGCGKDRYSLNGTPADCVRVGLIYLAADVDFVLSGINDGGNLGVDVYMSGTVAAAREAALLGKPAISLSQFRRQRDVSNWQGSGEMAFRLLQDLLLRRHPPRTFWNVNFPDEPNQKTQDVPINDCPLDKHPLQIDYNLVAGNLFYRGEYQLRKHSPGTDVGRCFAGSVSVTNVEV
jgi:5'-nucleotidase